VALTPLQEAFARSEETIPATSSCFSTFQAVSVTKVYFSCPAELLTLETLKLNVQIEALPSPALLGQDVQ
jgi:hypothetical protein